MISFLKVSYLARFLRTKSFPCVPSIVLWSVLQNAVTRSRITAIGLSVVNSSGSRLKSLVSFAKRSSTLFLMPGRLCAGFQAKQNEANEGYALVLDQANQEPARVLDEISHAEARLVIEARPRLRAAKKRLFPLLELGSRMPFRSIFIGGQLDTIITVPQIRSCSFKDVPPLV